MEEFQKQQPEIYYVIFRDLSDAVAEENSEMADLFLDMCFDIIWLYREAYGKPPRIKRRKQRVLESFEALDEELRALSDDTPMDDGTRLKLHCRFAQRTAATGIQKDLLEILNAEVEKYAYFKKERQSAVDMTFCFLFIIVGLMEDIYAEKKSVSARGRRAKG
jgi:hypothetical protein